MRKLVQGIDVQRKGRVERTHKLIDNYRGLPGEFDMLKGVLCMDHSLNGYSLESANGLFDRLEIARRMDEINKEARE